MNWAKDMLELLISIMAFCVPLHFLRGDSGKMKNLRRYLSLGNPVAFQINFANCSVLQFMAKSNDQMKSFH